MRAMVLDHSAPVESRPLQERNVPVPDPGPGEILIRVSACGICRTDLHVIEGDLPPARRPLIPGHQVVGVVERTGDGAFRLPQGTRVGIAWLRETCGTCVECRAGRENLCPSARFTGHHADGGFAEVAIVREDFAYPLPLELSDLEAAPLLCAGIIGYRALKRADVRPGCRLGIYGFGASAHLAIQVARHWGCAVYVMTRDAKHRDLARELGAVWAGDATERPPEPLDSAILFAPAGELVVPALEALGRGGTLAVAGIHLTDIPVLNYDRHLFYEKTLRSVTANTRADGEEFLKTAAEIPIRPRTVSFPLREANEALIQLKRDGLRGAGVLVIER